MTELRQPNYTIEVDDGGYANAWNLDEFIVESYDHARDVTDSEDDAQYDAHTQLITGLIEGKLHQVGDYFILLKRYARQNGWIYLPRFAGNTITLLPDAEPQPYEKAIQEAALIQQNGGTIISITAEPHPDSGNHYAVYYSGWDKYQKGV